jgi:hypothetical protein
VWGVRIGIRDEGWRLHQQLECDGAVPVLPVCEWRRVLQADKYQLWESMARPWDLCWFHCVQRLCGECSRSGFILWQDCLGDSVVLIYLLCLVFRAYRPSVHRSSSALRNDELRVVVVAHAFIGLFRACPFFLSSASAAPSTSHKL